MVLPLSTEIIDRAIAVHKKWKVAFTEFMQGKVDFDPVQVARNDRCLLGQWRESDGREQLLPGDYMTIHTLHTAFHQVAAQVVDLTHRGERAEAWALTADGGLFAQRSASLIAHLTAVQNKLA
jgi:Chemoreceptor zinc-binding domain